MTSVVSNPSGRKSAKDRKANPSKSGNAVHSATATTSETDSINNTDEFGRKNDKFQPTAEQMRLASLMTDKKEDIELKRKIEQVCELTGANREDASIALYDCDNDVHKAVEMILDGDTLESEWQSTGKKKNKAKGQSAQTAGGVSGDNAAAGGGLTNGSKKFDKTQRSSVKSTNNGPGLNSNAVGGGKSQRSIAGGGASPGGPGVGGGPAAKTGGGVGGAKRNGTGNTNIRDGKRSDAQFEGDYGDEDIFAKAGSGTIAAANAAASGAGGPAPGGGGGEFGNTRRPQNFNNRRGGPRVGRGAPRGRGQGGPPRNAAPRTFNSNRPGASAGSGDLFPNTIDTWTSPNETSKSTNDDLQPMPVGNWSDIVAASEDWNEDDWTNAPVETKVFTPSTKTIPEEEGGKPQVNSSNASQMKSYLAAGAAGNKPSEPQQPTMSAILSGSVKRQQQPQPQQPNQQQQPTQPQQQAPQPQQPTSQSVTTGQALLQQIQQNRNLSQMNQLSQFSKQATESIKSLVGLNSSSMLSNEIIAAGANDSNLNTSNLAATQASKQSQPPSQPAPVSQNRIKVQQPSRTSKIPDAAVEMHTDQMANLSVRFGSLEFGGNTPFSIGSNDSILFESVTGQKKPESTGNKNLSFTSGVEVPSATGGANFRQQQQQPSQQQQQQQSTQQQQANLSVAGGKSNMMQSNVISQRLNDSLIGGGGSSEHRNDNAAVGAAGNKGLAYNAGGNKQQPQQSQQQQQQDSRDKYLNYKYQANQDGGNSQAYSAYNQNANSYYSNSAGQGQLFGNSNVSQSLMGANAGGANAYSSAGTTYGGNQSNANKLRGEIDAGSNAAPQQHQSTQQAAGSQQQQQAGTKSVYDGSNVSSAGKSVHAVPPSVQQAPAAAAAAPVLNAPYMLGNTGLPITAYSPYGYDPFTSRDPNFSTALSNAYATQGSSLATGMVPQMSNLSFQQQSTTDGKYGRVGQDTADNNMLPVVSSQAAGGVQTAATQAHNQPTFYPPGYGFYFGIPQAHLYNPAHPAAMFSMQQPQANQAATNSAFNKGTPGSNYGSHSYNTGYDSLGSSVAPQGQQDYGGKNYQQMQQQQQQQHKSMAGGNANTGAGGNDLTSGGGQQSLYNKSHQLNKNYDNKNFQTPQQQQQQFNLGGGNNQSAAAAAATMQSYGSGYMLPQQQAAMHHTLSAGDASAGAGGGQQSGGGGGGGAVGNQRNMSQAHKGAGSSSTSNYNKFGSWNMN